MSNHIDIVFDGPPGPEAGRFVEVENADRRSINFGEWIHRDDGYWVLRIAASNDGKASTDRLQSKEVLLVSARIPLRCLACGNVVMTPRQEEEARAAHIATSACTECDPHGERHEQFYFTRDGRLLSYGQWMEHLEKPGASSATKAAVDLLEGNPEDSYGALVAGALLECRDLLSGMVGLVDLLLNRADLPVEVRNVLRSNHRIVDARAALNPAGPA